MIRFIKRLFCRHTERDFVRNIYGDEIIEYGWKRSIWRCAKCSKLLYDDLPHTQVSQRKPMSYAEQLPKHYERFIAGGNRAADFDRLLTHAPALVLLQNSQEQITQGYMADSLTSDDPAFMWGYANRLRDKGQLPNHFDAPDDDACNAVFNVLVQFLSLSK